MAEPFRTPSATTAIMDYLAQRERDTRQKMLDTLAADKQKADAERGQQMHEREMRSLDIAQKNAEIQASREQREAKKDQLTATGAAAKVTKPGTELTGDVARQMAEFYPGLVQTTAPTSIGGGPPPDPALGPGYEATLVPGKTVYAGTPEQQAMGRFQTSQSPMDAAEAGLLEGKALMDAVNPQEETQALFRVSADRRSVERFENGKFVPHTGAIPEKAHWLPEPQPRDPGIGGRADQNHLNTILQTMQRDPLIRMLPRTLVVRDVADRVLTDPSGAGKDPATQQNLVYGFVQIIDTYQTGVREGEVRSLGDAASHWDNLKKEIERFSSGASVGPDFLARIANESKRIATVLEEAGNRQIEDVYAPWAESQGVSEGFTTATRRRGRNAPKREAPAAAAPPKPTTTKSGRPVLVQD